MADMLQTRLTTPCYYKTLLPDFQEILPSYSGTAGRQPQVDNVHKNIVYTNNTSHAHKSKSCTTPPYFHDKAKEEPILTLLWLFQLEEL